jgi:hypothetical protein
MFGDHLTMEGGKTMAAEEICRDIEVLEQTLVWTVRNGDQESDMHAAQVAEIAMKLIARHMDLIRLTGQDTKQMSRC